MNNDILPMLGSIQMFTGNFAPKGWTFCNGQLLNISTNQELFSVIGNTYGGDGVATFGIPDLQGRVPLGTGNNNIHPNGEQGGEYAHTLTVDEMPSHNHQAIVTQDGGGIAYGSILAGGPANTNMAMGNLMGESPSAGIQPLNIYSDENSSNNYMAEGAVEVDLNNIPKPSATVTSEGEQQPHYNMQPYLAINFIIAITGYYPEKP